MLEVERREGISIGTGLEEEVFEEEAEEVVNVRCLVIVGIVDLVVGP